MRRWCLPCPVFVSRTEKQWVSESFAALIIADAIIIQAISLAWIPLRFDDVFNSIYFWKISTVALSQLRRERGMVEFSLQQSLQDKRVMHHASMVTEVEYPLQTLLYNALAFVVSNRPKQSVQLQNMNHEKWVTSVMNELQWTIIEITYGWFLHSIFNSMFTVRGI